MDRRHLTHFATATALLGGLVAGPNAANAQSTTASATMAVSVEITPNCTVAAAPLAFGTVTAAAAPSREASALIEIACGPEVSFTVALDDGQNPGSGTRRVLDPATGQYLAYDIFADAAHSQRWGASGTDSVASVTSPSGTTMLKAYGVIGSGTSASPGSYGDLVTVTASF